MELKYVKLYYILTYFRAVSIRIHLKNNPAKFHHGPIWNDGVLGFFEERRPDKKNNKNKMV